LYYPEQISIRPGGGITPRGFRASKYAVPSFRS
jgi:hypothetical protein